ncbi:hypothetical protein D6D06_06222 [Aureobasidium pullulans]|nr:hypothetical protein D6D06_06222 [Aureobasidium pullulans]
MADQGHPTIKHKAAQGMCARYFPLSRSFLDWRIGLLNISSFVVQFTIAAKATLFYVEGTEHGAWLISVRLSSAVYLSLTYLVVTCVTVFVTFKYADCNTGLKNDWDPTSLADLIQLLVINDTRPSLEHALDYSRWRIMVTASTVKHRIGYWEMSLPGQRKPTIVYGIHSDGSDNTIPCPGHVQRFRGFLEPYGSPDPIQPNRSNDITSTMQTESVRCANGCDKYPYKKGPFVDELSFSYIYIPNLLAYVACLAWILIRIWFYDGVVLRTATWLIQSNNIAIAPNSTEFVSLGSTVVQIHNMFIYDKAADFRDLLAFILLRLGPINTMSLIGRSIKVLDTHHRWTQPFTDMYDAPASASSVLSQDYMTVSPLSVISQAWGNGHHKVVFFGVLSALDWVPALIVTGLCAITETGSGVIVRISPTAACLGMLWSIIYIYALSCAWPAQKRKLPRDVGSLYDLLCLFHDSELRWLPQFMRTATSKNMTKRWLHSSLVTSSHKVSFGVMGAPDNQHCGFDLAQHVRRVIPNPDLRDRAGEALGLSTRSRQSSPAADEEASIELEDVGGASAVRHRRVQSDEVTPPVGVSSAIEGFNA